MNVMMLGLTLVFLTACGTVENNKEDKRLTGAEGLEVLSGDAESEKDLNNAGLSAATDFYGTLIPIYRKYNQGAKDHLATNNASEANHLGYQLEYQRVGGLTVPHQYSVGKFYSPGRAPIYRCRHNTSGKHFVSRQHSCEGQVNEGRLGYVLVTGNKRYTKNIIYRCQKITNNPADVDYLITNYRWECTANGYTQPSVLGWEISRDAL